MFVFNNSTTEKDLYIPKCRGCNHAITLEIIARVEYTSFCRIRMYSMNRLEFLRFTARFYSLEGYM